MSHDLPGYNSLRVIYLTLKQGDTDLCFDILIVVFSKLVVAGLLTSKCLLMSLTLDSFFCRGNASAVPEFPSRLDWLNTSPLQLRRVSCFFVPYLRMCWFHLRCSEKRGLYVLSTEFVCVKCSDVPYHYFYG